MLSAHFFLCLPRLLFLWCCLPTFSSVCPVSSFSGDELCTSCLYLMWSCAVTLVSAKVFLVFLVCFVPSSSASEDQWLPTVFIFLVMCKDLGLCKGISCLICDFCPLFPLSASSPLIQKMNRVLTVSIFCGCVQGLGSPICPICDVARPALSSACLVFSSSGLEQSSNCLHLLWSCARTWFLQRSFLSNMQGREQNFFPILKKMDKFLSILKNLYTTTSANVAPSFSTHATQSKYWGGGQ